MLKKRIDVFTTEQVADLLGLDPKKDRWRIIRFAERKEYGLTPSVGEASGSGSRRLYDIENVCQIGLGLRLLETGLRSSVVGDAIDRIRRLGNLSDRVNLTEQKEPESLYVVMSLKPQIGKVLDESRIELITLVENFNQVEDILDDIQENSAKRLDFDLIVVAVGPTFRGIRSRLAQIQKGRGE